MAGIIVVEQQLGEYEGAVSCQKELLQCRRIEDAERDIAVSSIRCTFCCKYAA